ncbi:hypothetical protein DMC30DRAFT_406690 [Rhodotorula diobovata]|uniref:Uncharacterized protein n=1 Tax=Rhodotorula diobovata TaxID=5288 RepID=A0A5C5FJZ1_9BASI|nr:hypothetical protein DMC30DRAFT_406690 [Rhodotorula diobovata]
MVARCIVLRGGGEGSRPCDEEAVLFAERFKRIPIRLRPPGTIRPSAEANLAQVWPARNVGSEKGEEEGGRGRFHGKREVAEGRRREPLEARLELCKEACRADVPNDDIPERRNGGRFREGSWVDGRLQANDVGRRDDEGLIPPLAQFQATQAWHRPNLDLERIVEVENEEVVHEGEAGKERLDRIATDAEAVRVSLRCIDRRASSRGRSTDHVFSRRESDLERPDYRCDLRAQGGGPSLRDKRR